MSDNPFEKLAKRGQRPAVTHQRKRTARQHRAAASDEFEVGPRPPESASEVAREIPVPGVTMPNIAALGVVDDEVQASEAGSVEGSADPAPATGMGGLPLFQQEAPSWASFQRPVADLVETAEDELLVDWSVVRELIKLVGEDLQKVLGERRASQVPLEERRVLAQPLIVKVVQARADREATEGRQWSAEGETSYIKAVTDSMFGLGRWQPLLEIPDAENVIISGTEEVWVDHADGSRTFLPPVAESDDELTEQIERLAQNSTPRRAFDTMHTDVTINHLDRFRIHAVRDDIAGHPSVTIRQHLHTRIGLGDLVDQGMMPRDVAVFLAQAVILKRSIIIIGGVGDGKTTLLRALIDVIPFTERFATLETDLELYAHRMPGREHTLWMTARDGMGERTADGRLAGEIRVGELVPPSLRQLITRIIVGELRGDEAGAMFEAMQAGAGSMATLHAATVDTVPERLATLASRSSVYSFEQAQRAVGQSVDLVVHVKKVDGPQGRHRFIKDIRALSQGDTERAGGNVIYTADEYTGRQAAPFTPSSVREPRAFDHVQVELNRYGMELSA